jgi:hypothetical protein
MSFCDACESLLSPANEGERCMGCGGTLTERTPRESVESGNEGRPTTDLERFATTDSGSVKKRNATRWLDALEEPSPTELRRAVVPKPQGFSGRTYAADVSIVRVTGDAEFVETVAALFRPLLEMDEGRTRLEMDLQGTEDRETGEATGNYALYLGVAEWSG